MTGAVAAAVLGIAAIVLLVVVVRVRRRRQPPRVSRTCVTCDHLGSSELCKPCNGSGEHWVERPRKPS